MYTYIHYLHNIHTFHTCIHTYILICGVGFKPVISMFELWRWTYMTFISDFLVVVIIQFKDYVNCSRGAQILGAWSPQVEHVQVHLISVGLQYETCFMSCFWHPEFWGGVFVFEKSVLAWYVVYLFGLHPLPSLKYKF